MKRIYLTGAAILLFIILGINYYYKKNLQPVNDNAASAQTFIDTPRTNQVDNAPATPVPDTPPSQGTSQNTQSTTNEQQTSGSDLQNDKTGFASNRSHTYYGHKKNNSSCAPRTAHHAAHKTTHHYASAHRTTHHYAAKHTSSCEPLETVPAPEVTTTVHSTPVELKVEITKEYTGNAPSTIMGSTTTKLKEKAFYGGVKIGIEGGYNANMFHDNTYDNIWFSNFHAGLLFDFGLGRNWSLQVAPRYIGKGSTIKLADNFEEKLNLHYIELPLDFVYKTGNPGHTRFLIGAGGYISYLAGAEDHTKAEGSASVDPANPPAPLYNPSNVLTWDWGAGGFIGLETPAGITLKAGGEVGLRQIYQNPVTGDWQNRNTSALVSVGYLFGGARK